MIKFYFFGKVILKKLWKNGVILIEIKNRLKNMWNQKLIELLG